MSPVALIIFNRPDLVERQCERLRALPLEQLFVIADGPREGTDDHERCEAARAIIDSTEWSCDVRRNYADSNMGCARRIVSGLDWVFSMVDRAIILEDDCLAHPDFFRFCDELLARFETDDRVMQICGTNPMVSIRDPYSYRFSQHIVCWGWATWASAWACNDLAMNQSEQSINSILKKYLQGNRAAIEYWKKVLGMTRRGQLDAWDYPWQLSIWRHDGVAVLPTFNLISNAGFSDNATHTKNAGSNIANLPVRGLTFPLEHPPRNHYDFSHDAQFIDRFFNQGNRTGRWRPMVDKLISTTRKLFA